MGGVGRTPSPNARRRNETPAGHLEPPEEDVPDRLKKLRDRATYPAAVQQWWDVWVNSEQATIFQTTDWLRLQMLAPLVKQYYAKPGHYALAEIRQNESLLGGTVADRMRLRWKPKDDGNSDELPEDVADFMNYRKNA